MTTTDTRSSVLFYFSATAIALAGWWICYGMTLTPWFIYDDSYITLGNALALIGQKSSFSTPALTGSTSIAHALLVSALAIPFPPETALALSNFLPTISYAAGQMRLAQAMNVSRLNCTLVALLGCTTAGTTLHLFNGLETSLALAGIVWSLVFLQRNNQNALLILCGALPWIRPELAAWSGIAVLLGTYRNSRGIPRFSEITRSLLLLALGTSPFLAICWINTGLPIPNTISAKKMFFAEGCMPIDWKTDVVVENLLVWAGGLWIAAFGILLLPLTKIGRAGLFFSGIFIAAYWLNFPGALGHYDHRYLHIFVPFIVFSLIHFAKNLCPSNRIFTGAVISLLLPGIAISVPNVHIRALEGQAFTQDRLQPVTTWLNNIPPDSSVLVHDAGYVGFLSRRALKDFVGLKNPEFISTHRTLTYMTCGRERTRAIKEILLLTQPSHIVILNSWDQIFRISDGLKNSGVDLHSVFHDPFGYTIYEVHTDTTIR